MNKISDELNDLLIGTTVHYAGDSHFVLSVDLDTESYDWKLTLHTNTCNLYMHDFNHVFRKYEMSITLVKFYLKNQNLHLVFLDKHRIKHDEILDERVKFIRSFSDLTE